MDRGKRRARSNRIGVEGEAIFRVWASRQGLTANKVEEDLGIDFFCQVLEPVGATGSEESTGRVLGAQVKATEMADSSPRLVLDRTDAVDLLRQTHATCMIGIHLKTDEVRFRFLDKTEIDRLLRFLATDNEQISLPFSQMEADARAFRRQLRQFTHPTVEQQLRIYQIQQRVSAGIPGSEIMIAQSATDTLCHIAVPWINSAFTVDPKARADVRVRVLNYGEVPLSHPGVSLNPEVIRAVGAVPGIGVLTGVRERPVKLTVEWQDKHASATFMLRHFQDEFAYALRPGLRLSMSNARRTEQGFVHEMESDPFAPLRRSPISGKSLAFLRLLRPGARLHLSRGHTVPVDAFGEALGMVGPAVDAAQAIYEALSMDFRDFQLVDLRDEEFGRALGFLDSFLLQAAPLERLVPGFIIGPSADLPPDQIPTRKVSLTVPIALNLKDTGIAIRLNCDGTAFLKDGLWCGFRIDRQNDWRGQKLSRFTKSVFPELWAAEDWPAIRIGDSEPGVRDWTREKVSQITLSARVEPK